MIDTVNAAKKKSEAEEMIRKKNLEAIEVNKGQQATLREETQQRLADETMSEEPPRVEIPPCTKEGYDQWLKQMNEGKYHHYIAWFNVNIKQVNVEDVQVCEIPETKHDFRIKVPDEPAPPSTCNLSIVDRLKLTAARRAQQMQPVVPQGVAIAKCEIPK